MNGPLLSVAIRYWHYGPVCPRSLAGVFNQESVNNAANNNMQVVSNNGMPWYKRGGPWLRRGGTTTTVP